MIKFTIKLIFNDVDDNYVTKGKVVMTFPVEADDVETARHLGQRLQGKFGADHLVVSIDGE